MYRTLFVCVLCCLILVPGLSAPATAQSGNSGFRLSLADCLRIALENNLDLVSARFNPEVAEQDILNADSSFDVGFRSSVSRSERQSVATQGSSVTGSETDSINAGIQQNLRNGANYSANFEFNKSFLTGPNVLAPESFGSGIALSFTQPLLKNLGRENTTQQLILARTNYEVSLRDLEGQAESVVESVEGAYWNVVAAREALRISRLRLNRAEDLLDLNRKKVEVGTLAPIEITQAEAGVAAQEEGLIVAETNLQDAEDELRRLLAIPESDPRWDMAIDATDRPEFKIEAIDLDAAIETALEARSEMYRTRQTVRDRELSERVAKRDLRPQVDLNLAYTPQGASLDASRPVFDPVTEDLLGFVTLSKAKADESFSNIFDGDVYNWSASITWTQSIGNRAVKSTYARARLSREQSETDLKNQEQTIRVEVRRAVRAVESGGKRVAAAVKNVELQQKKLDAELKKLDNGMSTSFEVLTFQEDLANAELSEIQARLDHIKALAALERSKGTLLEARNLSLAK